ncbi:MAG: hypothetical protein EOP48_25065 [Sphingobacteriales bacterium]|nr:MAG: hypothetical protein EOP48_25065 [Sphingobacteriales bacterium]
MHLRYSIEVADYERETRHPLRVVRELGITFQSENHHQIAAAWLFWNCKGVPADLPPYLSEYKVDPDDLVGEVLTQEEATRIKTQQNKG